MVLHVRGDAAKRAAPIVPWFVAVFALLVVMGGFGWIPGAAIGTAARSPAGSPGIAMAAIGMKTPLRSLVQVGPRATVLAIVETALLALFVFASLGWIGRHGPL